MRPFIILSTQRSGSTYFVRYFGSHPDIYCQGELFIDVKQNFRFRAYLKPGSRFKRELNPQFQHFRNYLRQSIWQQIEYTFFKKRLTENFLSMIFAGAGDKKAVGFKLMYSQNYGIIVDWLKRNDVSIIHLMRLNYLKIWISRCRMQATKIPHSSKTLKTEKIRVKTKNLVKKLASLEKECENNRTIFSSFGRYHEVTYEDFFSDQAAEQRKILQFLELDESARLSCNLKKINPNRIDALVENYDQVKSALEGTKYFQLLES